ncbi:hypothetical protein HDU93_003001 [Gonapodya sp. JEL0774]|nr:hypothetical protein HDU93_003001 [Gonapodya sp. JEL0774]
MAEPSALLQALKKHGAIISSTITDVGSNPVTFDISVGKSSGSGNGLFLSKAIPSKDTESDSDQIAGLHNEEEVCVAFIPSSLILSTDTVIELTTAIDEAIGQFGAEGSQLGFLFGAFLEKFSEDEDVPALSERTIVMLFLLYLRIVADVEKSSPMLEKEVDNAILSILAPFRAYCSVLPTVEQFDVPITWPATTLKRRLLRGTDLYAGTDAKLRTLKREWTEIGQKFKEACESEIGKNKIDLETWIWSDCVWWSRVIEIPSQNSHEQLVGDHDHGGTACTHDHSHSHSHAHGGHDDEEEEEGEDDRDGAVNALIPLVDFLNHKTDHNSRWEPTPEGMAIMVQRKWIGGFKAGGDPQEMFITYGEKTNDRLLFVHGFTSGETTHQNFTFPIPGIPGLVEHLLGNDPTAEEDDDQLNEEAIKNLTVKQEVAMMWSRSPTVKISVPIKSAESETVTAAAPGSVISVALKDAVDAQGLTTIYVCALDDDDIALEFPKGWGEHTHDGSEGADHNHDHDHDPENLPRVLLFGGTEDAITLPVTVGPAVLSYLAETALQGERKEKIIRNARVLVRDGARNAAEALEETRKEMENEVAAVLRKPEGDIERTKVVDILRLRTEQANAAKWVIARLAASDV